MIKDIRRDKIHWDEEIPDSIVQVWNKFLSEIHTLMSFETTKYMNSYHQNDDQFSLRDSCDRSSKAYAAVDNLPGITADEVFVSLIAAKAKISPIKPQTMPPIEL